MKTTLYLIRHGQTEWNVSRRMQGRLDSPLTAKGIRMAESLAPHLPPIDYIYASPAGRTQHTARLLFGEQPFEIDDRLREMDLGEWEGRRQSDLDMEDAERHANFWNAPHHFKCLGGENFCCVEQRASKCLHEIALRHPGQRIALISHTIIIRAMVFSINRRPLAEFWHPPAIYPASLTELEMENGEFHIVRLGDIEHYADEDQPVGAY